MEISSVVFTYYTPFGTTNHWTELNLQKKKSNENIGTNRQHYYLLIMMVLLLSIIMTETLWQSLFTSVTFKDQETLLKKHKTLVITINEKKKKEEKRH